jgi:hypothetical protein
MLALNDDTLNQQALAIMKVYGIAAPEHHLHLLNLAQAGIEHFGTMIAGPQAHALTEQVSLLFGWKPQNVMDWLLTNPNGPDREEQEENLLFSLKMATSAEQASAAVLEAIWSRQQADNPALQPSASGSD